MRPPVIAITGPARAGKDTIGSYILNRWGGYRYGFADPLKAMLAAGMGIDFRNPLWVKRKEDVIPAIGKSPRQLMQTLGTDWGREMVHPDLWVILAMDHLRRSGPGMVVTDMRFENEAAWVRKIGGLVIHVRRKDAQKVHEHKSEAGVFVETTDKMILNNGSLEELEQAIQTALSGLMDEREAA